MTFGINPLGPAPQSTVPTGTLTGPAPAGHYELSWTANAFSQLGTGRSGFAQLDLTVVPEPMAIATAGMLSLLLRRRR
jgi:hypothetical protein